MEKYTRENFHKWLEDKYFISNKEPNYWMCKPDHYYVLMHRMVVGYLIEYFDSFTGSLINWRRDPESFKEPNYDNLISLLDK